MTEEELMRQGIEDGFMMKVREMFGVLVSNMTRNDPEAIVKFRHGMNITKKARIDAIMEIGE